MKYLIIYFLILFPSLMLFASGAEDMLQKGNTFYQENQYGQAIDAYEKVLSSGQFSKELYYNLGNAYFKAGRIGYAILNYEKALKLDPNDEDIIYNLKIANARTVDKIETMPTLFLIRWWDALVNMFTVNGWTLTAFAWYIILLAAIGLYFLSGRIALQKWAFISGTVFLLIFIFSITILIAKYNYDTARHYGVVVELSVTVKLSPDERSGDAFLIHEGIKVNLEDKLAKWIKIRLKDGKVGWLPENEVKNI